MQATITYLLTEQTQRAQMAATGQPVARKQTMTIDVPVEDLPLCKITETGEASIELGWSKIWPALAAAGWERNGAATVSATAFAPDVIADIKRGQSALDAAYSLACANASQYVLDTPGEMMENPAGSYYVHVPRQILAANAELLAIQPGLSLIHISEPTRP